MSTPKNKKEFWEEGVRFECQGTGQCCLSRGEYGFVYMTLKDRRRMAKHMGIETRAFTKKYCDQTGGHFHLRNPELDCEFLVDGKKCGVYEGRPDQCRTWPFWPENMNAKTWKRDIIPFCAGVGKGRLYTAAEIKKIMKSVTIEV